ncbi:MAG: DUF6531 domain-containing protein [Kiritimatiellaeota bacterium]|nr:DUF6531 domain-containing protein [Kiritimatiellota bacterium]
MVKARATIPTTVMAATMMLAAMARAELPRGWRGFPGSPEAMARVHEDYVARGAGAILPLEIPFVKMGQGAVALEEGHGFTQGFLEGLVCADLGGVDTWPVSVFMGDDGTFLFQNADDEIFWRVYPLSAYDPLWLFTLRGGDSLAWRLAARGEPVERRESIQARAEALWDPGRVVTMWTFIRAEDAEAYRVARAADLAARNSPRVVRPTDGPDPAPTRGGGLDPEVIVIEAFAPTNNAYHLAYRVGDTFAEAYAGSGSNLVVRFAKDLRLPLAEWDFFMNAPTPALGASTNVALPFCFIPGYTNDFPSVHDNTCLFDEVVVQTPLGDWRTNTVWLCGHDQTPPRDQGFFHLVTRDYEGEFFGISRPWLVRNGLFDAFATNAVMAFAGVPGDPFAMTYLDYFLSGWDVAAPPPPPLAGEMLGVPFRIYGDWAAWEMTVAGFEGDKRVFRLSTSAPGGSDAKTLHLRRGASYRITMKWRGSGEHTNPYWYCWEAKVGGLPVAQSFKDYNSTRLPGNVEIIGPGWRAENASGLLTAHVHCNDERGGNIASGLSAILRVDPPPPPDTAHDETNPDKVCASYGEPVNVVTGAMWFEVADMAVAAPGAALVFNRHYNSVDDWAGGVFGLPGWRSSFDWRLGEEEQDVLYKGVRGDYRKVHMPDGQVFAFQRDDVSGGWFAFDSADARLEPAPADGWRVTFPGGASALFDADGKILEFSDNAATPNVLAFAYGPDEKPVSVTHTLGQMIAFAYDGSGRLSTVASPDAAHFAEYAYDASNRLASVTLRAAANNAALTIEMFAYEDAASHRITQRVGANGTHYNYAYDTEGRAVSSWLNANAFRTDYTYAPEPYPNSTRVTTHRSATESVKTLVTFDPATRRVVAKLNETDGSMRRYAYDAAQDLVEETLVEGDHFITTLREYDAWHNLTAEATALDAVPDFQTQGVFFKYDSRFALPSCVTDSLGHSTTNLYDAFGNLAESRRLPLPGSPLPPLATTFHYTPNGQPAKILSPAGRGAWFDYDIRGNPASTSNAVARTLATYDAFANPVVISDNFNSVTNHPDAFGRPSQIDHPDGLSEHFTRDKNGAVLSAIDRAGRVSNFTYELGRPATATRFLNAAPVTESVARDWQLDETSVSDALNQKIESYTLDAQGRVKTITNPEGRTMTLTYLVGPIVASITYFDGYTLPLLYDSSCRLMRTHGFAYYVYRDNGQLAGITNNQYTVKWEHDEYSRVISEKSADSGGVVMLPRGGIKALSLRDPDGNITNASTLVSHPYSLQMGPVNFSGSWSFTNLNLLAYDAAGRVTTQTFNEGVFTYHYDPRGNLAVLSNAVLTADYAYDSLNRLTNIVYRNSSCATVAEFGYTLDSLGRATQARHKVGANTRTKNYTYDSLGRLAWTDDLAPTSPNPKAPPQPATQSYDLAGNRLATGYGTVDYTHNQITSPGFTHTALGGARQLPVPHPSYPVPRNVVLDWEALGERLTYIASSPGVPNYYDSAGRRIGGTPAVGVNAYRHVWAGDHIVLDCVFNLLMNPEWSYSWGVGVDNLLACTLYPVALPHEANPPAPQHFYPLRDRLGSIMGLVDSSGAIVATYDYDAWGNVASVSASVLPYTLREFRYRWQCREYVPIIHDTVLRTGLYYFRNRWYDPVSGRFLSKDPLGLGGGDLNLYAFCGNDPVNNKDPYGLWSGGGWNPLNWSRWAFTGTPNTTDADYKEVMKSLITKESGAAFMENFSRSSQGVVNAFTGGLFDPEDGLFYDTFNRQWEELEKETNKCNDSFDTGMLGGRVGIGTLAAAGGVMAAEHFGWINTTSQGNNVFRIISKPLQRGFRIDKPHHEKWFHSHFWKW